VLGEERDIVDAATPKENIQHGWVLLVNVTPLLKSGLHARETDATKGVPL